MHAIDVARRAQRVGSTYDCCVRWALIAIVSISAFACTSNEPYCSDFIDATGRAAVYCPGPRDEPVCDYPGQMAHFEEGSLGIVLVGGERPSCNADDEVVCPDTTTGDAYCIRDPEL
jgi:hypothetical protein